MSSPSPSFVVLVPVKPPAVGKSRLVGLGDDVRAELAAAFALDTVQACLAATGVAEVLVATDDASFSASITALGAVCIPDGAATDLNETLRQTRAEAGRRWPHLHPVALCADLPALRPLDLDGVLSLLPRGRPAIVSDAAGVGTTLYAAPAAAFVPQYGGPSRAAHLASGALEVEAAASVRRDVDDVVDLAAAVTLGVGPSTAAALERTGVF